MSVPAPGIVVQARIGSTRLPGKVLLPLQGDTVLGHLVGRLGRCERVDRIVIATTELPADDAVEAEARRLGVESMRGSETDLLDRHAAAAGRFGIDPVVRITSDCPLADPAVVDAAVARFLGARAEGRAVDIVTNTREGRRTYPRGLDVEVVRRELLEKARGLVPPDAPEREHATLWFYRHPEGLDIEDLVAATDASAHRWTLDTPEDLELIRRVYAELYPRKPAFDTADVLRLLAERPEIAALNAGVRQKEA